MLRKRLASIFTSLVLSLLGVGLVTCSGEIYLRKVIPFNQSTWPAKLDPRVGFLFEPGATIQQTNYVDFWVSSRVNRWGFLDREPTRTSTAGNCNVVILGDSFVEAVQTPLESRIQVELESLLAERAPGLSVRTYAFGYSGTGQTNQLPFYDEFARRLSPRVVVLVFVPNDFANNSPELEAVRNGWDPRHAPRLFYRRTDDSNFTTLPIDPEWQKHLLPAVPSTTSRCQRWHSELFARSYLYDWVYTQVSIQYPSWVSGLAGRPLSDIYIERMKAIEALPGYERSFEGWRYPNDFDMDMIYCTEGPLPPVFEAALAETGHALDLFASRAKQDGATLIALSSYGISTNGVADGFGRKAIARGYRGRLEELLKPRGIPVIDQSDYIQSVHGRLEDAYFSRNAHWSPQGHRWAAEALAAYFGEHPELCARHSR